MHCSTASMLCTTSCTNSRQIQWHFQPQCQPHTDQSTISSGMLQVGTDSTAEGGFYEGKRGLQPLPCPGSHLHVCRLQRRRLLLLRGRGRRRRRRGRAVHEPRDHRPPAAGAAGGAGGAGLGLEPPLQSRMDGPVVCSKEGYTGHDAWGLQRAGWSHWDRGNSMGERCPMGGSGSSIFSTKRNPVAALCVSQNLPKKRNTPPLLLKSSSE
jgi:hypothetical protein